MPSRNWARPTKHVQERINVRLHGLVTMDDVYNAIDSECVRPNDPYKVVEVKRFPSRIEIMESDDRESNSKGDILMVVVRYGNIVTAFLRKSSSESNNYR